VQKQTDPALRRSQHEGGDMKKQSLTLATVLSLLLAAGSAFAQTINVKADIPFGFAVNHQTLPPGEYSLKSIGPQHVVIMQSSDNRAVATMLMNSTHALDASAKTKLIFKRYEGRYFLSQVWVQGERSGLQLPTSKRESEVARDFQPQSVEILAQLK
jgi:hypothetical protein